jgi:CRISPR/Cas system-associated exonuclease Cas4 (RecB family)
LARGSLAHKAIELSIHWKGDPTPLELVDEAVASLANADSGLADWLRTTTDADRASLRSQANDRVVKFLECFPPLSTRWRPVTESRLRVELAGGRIILRGQADLVLGRAEGTTARKVIVDLKSGGFAPSHLDDLRFYALLETMRIGVPPRLVSSYYLDSGRPHPETVTEAVLEAAVARTVDGADRLVALLHDGKPPVKRTGAACRWCPVLAECAEGRSFLDHDDPDGLEPVDDDDDGDEIVLGDAEPETSHR